MGIAQHFTEHPAAVGETYGQHLRVAGSFAKTLAKATAACTVHALIPSLCERTASTAICELHARMTEGARADFVAQAMSACDDEQSAPAASS